MFKAVNGYYATMRNGEMVVGDTLTACTVAASAYLTDEAVQRDALPLPDDDGEKEEDRAWIKLTTP
jgi:hypothetical protein